MRNRILSCLLPLVVAGCGADLLPAPTGEISRPASDGLLHQGQRLQGQRLQGQRLQGQRLQGHLTGGVTLQGQDVTKVRVWKGELIGRRYWEVNGTTPSLDACASGNEPANWYDLLFADCGYEVEAVGSCSSGTSVTVTHKALHTDTCHATATALRVCKGNEPCEFGWPGWGGDPDTIGLGVGDCKDLQATFTCPSSGSYTVMSTSVGQIRFRLHANKGQYPGYDSLRGGDMNGAHLVGEATDDAGDVTDVEYRITGVKLAGDAAQLILLDGTPALSDDWHEDVLDDVSGKTYLYHLEHKVEHDDGSYEWASACYPDPNEPGFADWAIPVRGYWNEDGSFTDSTNRFTFACLSGVIAKCYKWGYRPYLSSEIKTAHQTCTRMARADYCGTGEPHTVDGTEINVWDIQLSSGPIQTNANPSNHDFEALWGPKGAYCIFRERLGGDYDEDEWPIPEICGPDKLNAYGYGMRGCTSVLPIHGLDYNEFRISNTVKNGSQFFYEPAPLVVSN